MGTQEYPQQPYGSTEGGPLAEADVGFRFDRQASCRCAPQLRVTLAYGGSWSSESVTALRFELGVAFW